VTIGTGAILLGPIIVGSNVRIGANTFVLVHDIPDNVTVAGVPGRIVKRNGKNCDEPLPKAEEKF
jgi:serine O-acetyltransferase